MVLHLIDFTLDPSEPIADRTAQRLELGVVALLQALVDLLLDRPDSEHGLVGFRHSIPNPDGEVEPLAQVGQRDAIGDGARVHLDLEFLRLTLPVHGQSDRVRARQYRGSLVPGRPEDAPLEVCPTLEPFVPAEAIRARGLGRGLAAASTEAESATGRLLLLLVLVIFVVGRLERSEDFVVRAQELERYFLRVLSEVVVDVDRIVEAAHRILRIEEPEVGLRYLGRELAKEAHAPHDPEGPPMRRNDEVVILHDQVRDLRHGKIQGEGLPRVAVVPRDVNRTLRGRVEQPGTGGVFSHRAHEVVLWDALDDLGPRLAVVLRFPYVRAAIVVHEIPDAGHVRLARCVRGRLDGVDAHEVGRIGGCHVVPRRRRRTRVARDVDIAVVRAHPNDVGIMRRRSDREDRRIRLDTRLVFRDRTTGSTDSRRVTPGQIGADLCPALPLRGRLPDLLRAGIENATVVLVEDDGEGPLDPLTDVLGGLTHRVLGPHVDRP